MTCHHVDLGNGARAIVCTGRQRPRKCKFCGRPATLLCDRVMVSGRICSANLCEGCAIKVDGEDWCSTHPLIEKKREADKQKDFFNQLERPKND